VKIGGIDPGLSGALAIKSGKDFNIFEKYTIDIGTKHDYDIPLMRRLLSDNRPDVVYIEAQQAMPGQGVSSMFKIGYGFGIWLGLLAGLEIPYQIVRPVTWQKEMFAGYTKSDTKDLSYKISSQLYPHIASLLKGPRGGLRDGICDAVLIATYGERKYGGS